MSALGPSGPLVFVVMSYCEVVTFPLYPGSGVVLDCIDS